MIDLKQGDCLELMKDIPDKSVDLKLLKIESTKHLMKNQVLFYCPKGEKDD